MTASAGASLARRLLAVLLVGAVIATFAAVAPGVAAAAGEDVLDPGFGTGGQVELTIEDVTGEAACVITEPNAPYTDPDPCLDRPSAFRVGRVLPAGDGGVLVAGEILRWTYEHEQYSGAQPRYLSLVRDLFVAKLDAAGQLDAGFATGGVAHVPVDELSTAARLANSTAPPSVTFQRLVDCIDPKTKYLYDPWACRRPNDTYPAYPDTGLVGAFVRPEGGLRLVAYTDAVCRDYPYAGRREARDDNGTIIEGQWETYSSLIACPKEQLITVVDGSGAVSSVVSDLYVVVDDGDDEDDPLRDLYPNGDLVAEDGREDPITDTVAYDANGWFVGADANDIQRISLSGARDPDFGPVNADQCWSCEHFQSDPTGRTYGWLGSSRAVVRYLSDGTRDPSYGTSGLAAVPTGNDDDVTALLVDSTGRAYVVGLRFAYSDDWVTTWFWTFAYRLTSSGTLDTSFGVGGRVELASPDERYVGVSRAALTAEDRLVLAGGLGDPYIYADGDFTTSSWEAAAVRLAEDGALDTTFGSNGWAIYGSPVEGEQLSADHLAVNPDGSVFTGSPVHEGSSTYTRYVVSKVGQLVCELILPAGGGDVATSSLVSSMGVDGSDETVSATSGTSPPDVNGWQVRGGFKQDGDVWVASGSMSLNGLTFEGKGGADVTFTLDPAQARLTASGQVSVTAGPVKIAGYDVGPITVFEGPLDWSFQSSEVRQAIVAGGVALGLATEGEAVLQALSTCATQVTLPVTLPAVLGGGAAELKMTVDLSTGLQPDSLSLVAENAVLGGVVKVASPRLDYSSGNGWTMASGQVDVGGEGVPLEGWLRHDGKGVPTAGHLSLAAVPVAGLATLPSLTLDYAAATRTWSGNMQSGDAKGSARFVYDAAGELSTANVNISSVDLFGALAVKSFVLDRASSGAWKVDGRAEVPGGGKLTGALSLSEQGTVVSGRIDAAAIRLGELLDLRGFALSYVAEGEKWDAATDLVLPGPAKTAVAAELSFANGAFVSGAVDVSSQAGIAVGPGVALTQIGAAVNTDPWKLAGTLSVNAGPVVAGVPAVRIDADGTIVFPSGETPGLYEVKGQVYVASMPLANGSVRYHTTPKLEFEGQLGGDTGWVLGPVSVKAALTGTATATAFSTKGTGQMTLGALNAAATVAANERGMAGCGKLQAGWAWETGFTYRWGAPAPDTFGEGCDLGAWRALGLGSVSAMSTGLRAASTFDESFAVADGLPAFVLKATAEEGAGAPAFTLTGPDEATYDATAAGTFDQHVVMHDADTTVVAVNAPVGGAWGLTLAEGSAAISSLEIADGLSAPDLDFEVGGSGTSRTITWDVTAVDGQTVRFVEHGPSVSQVIAEVSEGSGTVAFAPADGPAGVRTIEAEVLQFGLPRATVERTYEAVGTATLTLAVNGDGSGRVTGTGVDCAGECTVSVGYGTGLTLTGAPGAGSAFGEWSGDCVGDEDTCTITVNGPAAVTASFVPADEDDGPSPSPSPPGVDPPAGRVVRSVPAGGTVSTAPAGQRPSVSTPATSAVTSPNAGTVSIVQRGASVSVAPDGTTLLDLEVDISAPPAGSPNAPLVLDFALHPSLLPSASDGARLVVFRNGVRVPTCSDPSAGVAEPDPCANVTVASDGVVDVRVFTTRASVWTFGLADDAPPGAACDVAEGASFRDVDSNVHRSAIDCLAAWAITTGTAPGMYGPAGTVTRGQAAAFLARLVRAAGRELPAVTSPFVDVSSVHVHASDIAGLAAAGIIHGSDQHFSPSSPVTRGQMAALVVRTLSWLGGDVSEASGNWFDDDDGTTHEVPIGTARELGLVVGASERRYVPNAPIRRDQLATILANLLQHLADEDLLDGAGT